MNKEQEIQKEINNLESWIEMECLDGANGFICRQRREDGLKKSLKNIKRILED